MTSSTGLRRYSYSYGNSPEATSDVFLVSVFCIIGRPLEAEITRNRQPSPLKNK